MKPELEISTLNRISTRPRFKFYTDLSPDEFAENLTKYLSKNQKEFSGNINREIATIYVETEEQNLWKPNLSLRTEKEDGKTVIRGVFGPNSSIWTLFMFLYFTLGILWMVFISFWFVGTQIKSDDYEWGLPVSFGILFLILLTYLAARYGQKKAKREMAALRSFAIEAALPFEKKEEA